jgi:hypothetical protein
MVGWWMGIKDHKLNFHQTCEVECHGYSRATESTVATVAIRASVFSGS